MAGNPAKASLKGIGIRSGKIVLASTVLLGAMLVVPHSVSAQSSVQEVVRPEVPAPQPLAGDLSGNEPKSGSKAFAAELAPEQAKSAPEVLSSGQLTQTVLGLLFVIFLLFGLLWLMKRSGLAGPGQGNGIYKVLHVSSLGAREKIALVEVGDTWLLLGMTQHSINTLHTMPKGSISLNAANPQAAEAFARLLEKIRKPKASA